MIDNDNAPAAPTEHSTDVAHPPSTKPREFQGRLAQPFGYVNSVSGTATHTSATATGPLTRPHLKFWLN
jgi:hypothetical protein